MNLTPADKKCVLMKHGVYFFKNQLKGPCCYSSSGLVNQEYQIDPVHCQKCINEEAAGLQSYRQGVNSNYGFDYRENQIISLEITPNVNCNLTCKTCTEVSSTAWAKLKSIPINNSINQSPDDLRNFLSKFDLSKLKIINFSGGEPFLNNNIVKYIKSIEHLVDLSNITLRFSTNGTIRINQKLYDTLSKFKLVLARFSLDDIGEGHEYIRYPSVWTAWESNWEHFINNSPSNVIVSINRTVGILNLNRLNLLNHWHKKYQWTKFNDPIELLDHYCHGELALKNITLKAKNFILDTHGEDSIQYKFIKHISPAVDNQKMLAYIAKLDQYHNTEMKKYDLDWYNALSAKD